MVIIDYCGHSFFVQQDNDQKKYLIHEFFFFQKKIAFSDLGYDNQRKYKRREREVQKCHFWLPV